MAVQNDSVPALERALNILEYLTNYPQGVSLKEISDELNIPSASAFRLIKNLLRRGYVMESTTNGATTYTLGAKLLGLVHSQGNYAPLTLAAKPIMHKLAYQLLQTVQLGVWQNGSMIYVEQEVSPAPLSMLAALYEPLDINLSASAKVLMGFLSKEECARALDNCPFIARSPKTITCKEQFWNAIQLSKQQGHSYDDEEFALGLGCLAVPIYDASHQCIAALGITGSVQEYHDPIMFDTMLTSLKNASDMITQRLCV